MVSGGFIRLLKKNSVRFHSKDVLKKTSKGEVTGFNAKVCGLYSFTNVHVAYQKLPRIRNEVFTLLRALTHGVLKS